MSLSVAKRGRILLLTEGGVTDPRYHSGVNHYFYRALTAHYDVLVADVRFRGWRRYANALYAFSISPRKWRGIYYGNLWEFGEKTRLSERVLEQYRGQYDLIFQLYATHAPTRSVAPKPYVVYLDATHRQVELAYPAWDHFSTIQRERWYRLETRLYQQAARVFIRSEKDCQLLIDFYGLIPEKVIKVGAGINFRQWTRGPKRYDGRTILFVGRDFERKGGLSLLKAFSAVRQTHSDARLVIVGPEEPINQEGVEFLGLVRDRDYLQRIYEQASIFVLPSIFDASANVLREAMAHKLPCIGTQVGGTPDIVVNGETGYLVPPNQPEVLADRMRHLLDNADLMRQMGERSYERVVREFTWDKVVERMRPHLESLISKCWNEESL